MAQDLYPEPSWTTTFDGKTYRFWNAELPLEDLEVPTERQRDFRRGLYQKIKANFDPRLVKITVAFRDGKCIVVAGQHCMKAARDLGFTTWQCKIVECDSDQDEIRVRQGDNFAAPPKKKDNTWDRINLREEKILKILTILTETGYTYDRHGQAWNNLTDPALVEGLFDKYGEKLLKQVLTTMVKTWPGNRGARAKQNLLALAVLFGEYSASDGTFPTREVLQKLSPIPPDLWGMHTQKSQYWLGGDANGKASSIARWLQEEYNKRTRLEKYKLYHREALKLRKKSA